MKILFLRSNPVDPDSRVEKEVNSLIKSGHDVEILAWDRNKKYKIEESYVNLESGKAKIYRFGIPAIFGGGVRKNLFPLIKFQIKLYLWLYENKKKYDVIHACDFDTAYISSKVAKKLRKKFVYDIFDYYVDAFGVPQYLKKQIKKKDHEIINFADAVIICTEKRREQIKGTNPRQLTIIHNTPPNKFKKIDRVNLDNSKIKLVYVGILSDGRFIREIAEIVMSNPNYEFHIGGFGEYEEYFKDISKKHNNIKFYGKIPYEKTLELENSCDIMIAIYNPAIPNHIFAAPNKFYEALMLGKPLIMAKNTGVDNIVYKNDIGKVIEYDIKSLEDSIVEIVNRRNEWPEISLKMKNLYKEDFSWVEMERRLINLYKNIGNESEE